MFKGRKPILATLRERPQSAHPGRIAVMSLPRPFRKHKLDMMKEISNKDTSIDMDRFRYTPSEKDIRVKCPPQGVIAVHILELNNISIRVTKFNENAPMFFYCLVSIGTIRRMSKVVQSETRHRVRMDSTIYFTIEISDHRDDYRNKLRIELWAFQEPELHYIIGTKESHIYRIIQTVHGIETNLMWADGLMAASVTYEYAFAYGAFGYGHSDQLKNTDRSIFESVNNSLFPRIRLDNEDIIDNKFNTRIPIKLQVMSPSSFIYETPNGDQFYTGKGNPSAPADQVEPRFFTMHQVEFDSGIPVYCKVNMKMYQKEMEADFSEAHGEYVCLLTRKDRIDYLKGMLAGRLEDLVESEVGPLFMDMEEGVLENVIDADLYSGHLIYPERRPCTEYQPAQIAKEDEVLFAQFPSTSWTPGWLARVFGYTEPSTDPHFGEGDYPVVEAKVEIVQKQTYCQKLKFRVKYLWNCVTRFLYDLFQYIFPELRRTREIPEISVTLASPPGSTTDLYSQWVNEELEHPLHISERNAVQGSNLLSIHVNQDDDDLLTDSDEEESEEIEIGSDEVITADDFDD